MSDEYYGEDGALHKIDDLSLFIELADQMKRLADQGRINDMRRELVIAFVKHRESYYKTRTKEDGAMKESPISATPANSSLTSKQYFEANFLDGESLQYGQLVSAVDFKFIQVIAQKKYQEGELKGRIAGAKVYKDTLQSRMASAYENNVTIKEMEDWFNTWQEGQSQLERKEQ